MKKTPYLMHPKHPRWEEYMDKLYAACEFKFIEGDELRWKANCHPFKHLHSSTILESMGADVNASIAHFQTIGGGCDCEIIVNIDLFGRTESERV